MARLAPSKWTALVFTLALLLLAPSLSGVKAQPQTNQPDSMETGTPDAADEMEETDQATFASDYNAKHFSLVTGALVLNPFKIQSVDDDMDPMTPNQLRLEQGNTDAKLLLEAGFRRRWAWENWRSPEVRRLYSELRNVQQDLQTSRRDFTKTQDGQQLKDLIEIEIKTKGELLEARRKLSDSKPRAYLANWTERDRKKEGWSYLDTIALLALPDNYTVRLGFALGNDEASGAAGVAGGGDFFIETGIGFDWFRALYPTGQQPLKISFGPEFFASFSNDTEQDDFHQRYLFGLALTAGVPLGDAEERLAEIVVRAGYVSVEVPRFINDNNRLIKMKNERADFDSKSGLGVDVEINIPITKELGYIFLRATTNHGFNPNPWTTTVGYTLPLNNLLGTLGR